MSKKSKTAIEPTREQDFPTWYQKVVKASDLAEAAPVRGCMVIKPWGYALWENMKDHLDKEFKALGHKNAYFPLFIPLSYFQKEAKHVEGFATECAVVTHHRLGKDSKGELEPQSPLEEPLVVRPTSEMIIGETFSKWVESYRDLPLLINQWSNVVRWEMRPRIFLRTSEFLWQEGHTVHATEAEALAHTKKMLGVYVDFVQNQLAVPVIEGEKSANERFPGAVSTFTFEAMMQDGKALQGGTSHFLGQNFSRSSEIKFLDEEGKLQYGWTTSWGVTTRMIGSLIMVHGDDNGIVLPPKIAPVHVVILPILKKGADEAFIFEQADKLKAQLQACEFDGKPITVEVDKRDIRGGEKAWGWIKKGVPIRVELGQRELGEGCVFYKKRTESPQEGHKEAIEAFVGGIANHLEQMQTALFEKAKAYRDSRVHRLETKEEIYDFFKTHQGATDLGFVSAHFALNEQEEKQLKQELGVTVRCLPFEEEKGVCPFTNRESARRAIYAKAY